MKADSPQRKQVEEDRSLLLGVDGDQLAAMPPERGRVQHLEVGGLPADRWPVVDDLDLDDAVARPEQQSRLPPGAGGVRTLRRGRKYTRGGLPLGGGRRTTAAWARRHETPASDAGAGAGRGLRR